jgi:rRNA maturation endonuclease Nob1
MKYCVTCGRAVEYDDAYFCPYCGSRIRTASEIVQEDTAASILSGISTEDPIDVEPVTVLEPEDIEEGYRVVLISRGTCTAKMAKEVICDLLGYTVTTATSLLEEVPVELADELNERQAVVLAQALAEYGMQVTVVDENNRYMNIDSQATNTVYSSTGDLTAAALAVSGSRTAANRGHRYRRDKKPSLRDLIFKPAYKVPQPVHVRRKVVKEPESLRRIAVKKTRISKGIPPKTVRVSKPGNAPAGHGSVKPQSPARPQNAAKPNNARPQNAGKPQGGHGAAGSRHGGNAPKGGAPKGGRSGR